MPRSHAVTAEDVLALAWERLGLSSNMRLPEEALQIGVALYAGFGLSATWLQKQGAA